MSYEVKMEGFEGQNIEMTNSFWSGPKLLINGEPAPKGNQRGEMLLLRNDGRQVTASWKPQLLGYDVPQLIVDGKVVNIVEPLKWHEWLWGGLPILLLFIGGFIGALSGLIGFAINARIFRMEMNGVLKYLVTGAVSVLAVVVYFIAALLLRAIIGN